MTPTGRSWLMWLSGSLLVGAIAFGLLMFCGQAQDESRLDETTSTTPIAGRARPRRAVGATLTASPRAEKSADEPAPEAEASSARTVEPEKPRVLRGRVLKPDGRAEAGASVGIFKLDDRLRGRGRGTALHSTRSDATGDFAFECSLEDGLVVIAQARGFRPAIKRLLNRESIDPVLLKLELPSELRGAVTYNGREVTAGMISADAAFGTPGLFGMGPEMFWREGRPEVKHGSSRLSVKGRFRISALGPGNHDVHISPVVEGVDFDQLQPRTRCVAKVPDTAFNIAIEAAECTFTVLRDGVPDDNVEIEISADERVLKSRLNAREVAKRRAVALMPNESYSVVVKHPSVAPNVTVIRAPEQRRRLDMTLHVETIDRPYIELEIVGEGLPAIETLGLDLIPLSPSADRERLTTKARRDDDDRLRSELIPTAGGAYSLRVRPLKEGPEWYLIFEDTQVNLPPTGPAFVTLTATVGGRCLPRFDWKNIEAGFSLSWCLRNHEGQVILSDSIRAVGSSRGLMLMGALGGLGRSLPQREVIPARDYVLEIRRGKGAVEKRDLVIMAGETVRPRIRAREK